MGITIILIIITVLISISAFNNVELFNKLILWPKVMDNAKEYYRLLSSGFIHLDIQHLVFNMLALFFLGRGVEYYYAAIGHGGAYIWMYLTAIVAASLPSFFKHKDNYYYRALGASGGVAAVIMANVYFAPWNIIYIWFIPVPGILFAAAYLVYSAYMSKKGADNVGHDAHFWGAVYGFLFTIILDPTHGQIFFRQLINPSFNF